MKRIIDYFVDNPIVVHLLTLLIVLMGAFSLFSLNKETFPKVDFNYIVVTTAYPGTAAEDVEKLVTIDFERELKEVEGIEELNALSAEGGSIISIKVDSDYDVDQVLVDVKDAVDRVTDLPNDVEEPIVTRITNKTRSLMEIAFYGNEEWALRDKVKTVRDRLERDGRVSKVELQGYRDETFYVEADLPVLKRYEMTLAEVVQAISDRQVNVTAGSVVDPSGEKIIRTLVENDTVTSIENIVLRSNDIGSVVRIKDVAKVFRRLKDPEKEYRSMGELAIFLGIQSRSSADVLNTAEFIKTTVEEESKKLGLKYKVYQDLSFYVERRLGILTENGLFGIIFVTLCLMLFLNFRVSIITALGAPFAFFVAFSLMDSMNITVNLISMFGLIMVLGMLVDDSIIVAEQYFQRVEGGMKPREAAKKSALETVAPVTATIITTMVAFSSLFFMEGIMGKFVWPIPAVVIIALFASWLECFLILPGHLSDFGGSHKKAEKGQWYLPLLKLYGRSLDFALRYAKSTMLIFIGLFVLSILTLKTMRFELFPSDDVTRAQINIKGPVGASFERTKQNLLRIEKIIPKSVREGELKNYKTVVGYQRFKGGRSKTGDHYGSVELELNFIDELDRSSNEIISEISKNGSDVVDKDYTFSLEKFKNGPPSGKPLNVELYGDNLDELKTIAQKIKEDVLKFKGVLTTEVDYEEGKRQFVVKIDEAEARRLGLTNLQIASELRRAYEGAIATTIKKSDEDVEVIVRLNEDYRKSVKTLDQIEIANAQGRTVKLTKLAKIVEEEGSYLIRRLDRKRTVAVNGEIDTKLTTSVELTKTVTPYVEKLLKNYPGVNYKLGGENEDTQDSLRGFVKGLVGSNIIIFIILVVLFSSVRQPFIIMTAIPFGLIGVVASFKVLGLPIGFMALMGMLGLVGVVINDSIVLVTFINRKLQEEGYSIATLKSATMSRFRAVFLTTVTTVAGLLPVAHAPGGDPFLKPMATSFAYGLLFSSLITLVFVPCFYKVLIDWSPKLRSKLLAARADAHTESML